MATISIRVDEQEERALELLTQDGSSKSDAVRKALRLAMKAHMDEALRAEAEAMMNNSEDRAEVRRIQEEMEEMRAW